MREILFRGKRTDNGEWVFGMPWIFKDHACICPWKKGMCKYDTGYFPVFVKPKTIGQYIGLTDQNDEKIFEGDICRFREWDKGEMCWIGKIHYEHQQFVISGGANKECETSFLIPMSRFISENIEVIGNIYEHPALLGGADNTR